MGWQTRSILEQRVEFVVRAARGKESISALCREYGISRPTGYLWLKRYRDAGTVNALADRSHRPYVCPHATSRAVERKVIALRRKKGWGAKKLQHLLQAEKIEIPLRTINRIIARHGLVRAENKVTFANKRFERASPNELWQMDFKGEFNTQQGICYPLTILDDHSRYLVGLYPLDDTQTETVQRCLIDAFEQHGLPEAMLTDHGSPWWSTHSEHGLTRLSVSLIKQGIKLYYSGVGHPQTQGKVERFHRTLKERVLFRGLPKRHRGWNQLLADIRYEYNHERPHEALAMDVPAKRYRRSPRAYLSSPPQWEYQAGANLVRVDSAGCVRLHSKQYFLSHALIGEHVRLDEVNDSILLTYRHMIVREINRVTGEGKPVLLPRNETQM